MNTGFVGIKLGPDCHEECRYESEAAHLEVVLFVFHTRPLNEITQASLERRWLHHMDCPHTAWVNQMLKPFIKSSFTPMRNKMPRS